MASKRVSREEGQGNDERDLRVSGKRRRGEPEQAETPHLSSLASASSNVTNEIALYLEPVLRKVLQDVLPPMLQRHLSPCCGSGGGRVLQLCFMNKLPPTIFTQFKITAEGGSSLQIELRDAKSQQRIVREECYPMKIRICVLNGDFGSNENEDWIAEEFNAQTLSPREGKGPLLIGDTVITLENGVGYITEKIVFTDNSCWTRSKSFRLGVKIVQSNSIEADIREGRSEPFKVLDNRGVAYKKHDRPSLNDEVWRLKRIAKGGKLHKQLSLIGIKTVKDLLRLYITNQASLLEKIGKVAARSWDTIIEHAQGCDVNNDERYIYPAAEHLTFLVFNCIYEVVEVALNGQNFRSLQSLNFEEKLLVERVKQQAYKNLKDLVPLETTTQDLMKTLTGVQAAQYGDPGQGPRQFDFPIAQQGQPETWPYLCQASTSTSIIDEAARIDQEGSAEGQFISVDDGNGWLGNVSQIDEFASFFPPINQLVQANPFPYTYDDGAECSNRSSLPNSAVYVSSKGKRKTVWHKIRTALKWVIMHVAKRKAKSFHRQ
ncbi:calmodulin-binding protein 60 B-like [Gastrolobium bilobum]|uniref:calmodulin-binding protein 60 B-like n=1 Tax=Gastrolobium bilobum TaxID=150636 RepID=UPI002AB0EC56|nr:calmodulin-binding protein 60 B-like [Gastrolobium bilobum]